LISALASARNNTAASANTVKLSGRVLFNVIEALPPQVPLQDRCR
jgi:hypothetical protein